ncbi:MAG: hypothetical protein R3E39_18335 [Anaerolineae bacterium]
MTQPYQIELVEAGIMRIVWDGVLNKDTFQAGVADRVEFANAHQMEDYVLIFDLRKARITILDVRLAAWAANFDSRLTHTIIIGRSGPAMVAVNALVHLSAVELEFVATEDKALERARQIVKARAKFRED